MKKTRTTGSRLWQSGVFIIALILSSASIGYLIRGDDGPSEFTTIIGPGSLVSSDSFIVFRDSDVYYARNGMTGEVENYNADFSVLMNSLIDALPENGGKIVLKPGDYVVSSTINVDRSLIAIEGEAAGLSWTPTYKSVNLSHEGNVNVFTVDGDDADDGRVWSVTFRNLIIFDPFWTYTGYGIYVDNAAKLTFDNVRFERFRTGALYIRDTWTTDILGCIFSNCGNISLATSAVTFRGVYGTGDQNTDVTVDNCCFQNNNGTSIDAYGVIDHFVMNNWYAEHTAHAGTTPSFLFDSCGGVVVSNGYNYGSYGYAVQLKNMGYGRIVGSRMVDQRGTAIHVSLTYYVMVSGNYLTAHATECTGYGIISGPEATISGNHIEDFAGPGIDSTGVNSVISNNKIENCGASLPVWHTNTGLFVREERNVVTGNVFIQDTYQKSAVWVSSDGDYTVISDNNMRGTTWPVNYSCSRTLLTLSSNVGFNTSTFGTATISAGTYVTFNHNLYTTPTLVLASFNNTIYDSWKWSATTTQITITVLISADYTIYWSASW